MKTSRRSRDSAAARRDSLPLFCDYTCPHGAFTPPETSGACRRDQAVYCTLLRRYNNKHARCLARSRD